MINKHKVWLYLDDVRIPNSEHWQVVRNYDEFVAHIRLNGLENYEVISLDHDLGEGAMIEYYTNVKPNYELDYNRIPEKTGMDCDAPEQILSEEERHRRYNIMKQNKQ